MMPQNQQSISGTLTKIVYFLAVVGLFSIFAIGVLFGIAVTGAI